MFLPFLAATLIPHDPQDDEPEETPGPTTVQDVYAALQRTTQALKDIINAADAGNAYSAEELKGSFQDDYDEGYRILASLGISELA